MSTRLRLPLTVFTAAAVLSLGPGVAAAGDDPTAPLPTDPVVNAPSTTLGAGEGAGEGDGGSAGQGSERPGPESSTTTLPSELDETLPLPGDLPADIPGNLPIGPPAGTPVGPPADGEDGVAPDDGGTGGSPAVEGCEQLAGGGEELEALLGDGTLDELCGKLDEGAAGLAAVCGTLAAAGGQGSDDLRAVIDQLCSAIGGGGGSPTPIPTPTTPATNTPAPQPVQAAPFQYENCDDARVRGAAPVYAGQYGFGPHLDRDSDGIGCEVETAAPVTQPVAYSGGGGTLAYTGVETEPLLAWSAALLASGAGLIFAGRRRA